MTLEEAIKNREDCMKYLEGLGQKASPDCLEAVRWSVKALKALRPVSREQVEKVWRGCDFCKKEMDDYPYIVAHSDYSSSDTCYEPSFCPICGKPLTDEAVDMVMERLEALHEDNSGS